MPVTDLFNEMQDVPLEGSGDHAATQQQANGAAPASRNPFMTDL